MILRVEEKLAGEVTRVIKVGDMDSLQKLLDAHPGLAAAQIKDDRGSKTVLHVVTDWPGFFPNGPMVVKMLISAGADPNVRTEGGGFAETPLHWAASSDDVEVAEALIASGADMEAGGASIAGGTTLDNAVGYGCWRVARLLVERGAKVQKPWIAAALGMTSVTASFFKDGSAASTEELNHAFWHACRGGYRRTAEYLLAKGADLNWIPEYARDTALQAAGNGMDTARESLVNWLRGKGAK